MSISQCLFSAQAWMLGSTNTCSARSRSMIRIASPNGLYGVAAVDQAADQLVEHVGTDEQQDLADRSRQPRGSTRVSIQSKDAPHRQRSILPSAVFDLC